MSIFFCKLHTYLQIISIIQEFNNYLMIKDELSYAVKLTSALFINVQWSLRRKSVAAVRLCETPLAWFKSDRHMVICMEKHMASLFGIEYKQNWQNRNKDS
ncbi:hypothetical protein D917_00852 [Trichinella nativa]|uniref:Uncharacterized protein n=1 Tax=Trichinella nativa TaxID=6335 RepID=A0A1Y3E3U1_9BILA|nr:hypothetical protein D917_00852 [Trichinella nativa]